MGAVTLVSHCQSPPAASRFVALEDSPIRSASSGTEDEGSPQVIAIWAALRCRYYGDAGLACQIAGTASWAHLLPFTSSLSRPSAAASAYERAAASCPGTSGASSR